MPERILLRCGSSPWLEHLRVALAILSASTVLLSNSGVAWKFAALAALLLFWHYSGRFWQKHQANTRITLRREGPEIVSNVAGTRWRVSPGTAWISRWLCVFRLREYDSNRVLTCVVCASENHPQDFRRLLVWFRMRPSEPRGDLAT